jgi:integrase
MHTSKLSEETVKGLPAPAAGNRIYYFAGAKLQGFVAPRGFGVRVTQAGAKAFIINYRLGRDERRFTIGAWPDWTVIRALKHARALRQTIDRGQDPQAAKKAARAPAGTTIGDVLDDYIRERARGRLRGADARESAFEQHVKPAIGNKGLGEITRDEIITMRQRIAKGAGPVMADRTFAYFRAAMRWFANSQRGGDVFDVRKLSIGEPLTSSKDRERTRTLSAAEIRIIWPQLEQAGAFGALCQLLLLTGQRRGEVAGMSRAELIEDDLWEIPADRFKGKRPHAVPLSTAAAALVKKQLEAGGCDYAFPSSAKTAFTAFGKAKAALDAAVLGAMREQARERGENPKKVEPIPAWTLHDLRRSARTMLSEIGVLYEVAERVIGHAQGALERTYNRFAYVAEKRDALEKLASHIAGLVDPKAGNVVQLPARRR